MCFSLTGFISVVEDLRATLEEISDSEDDMAEMYLTHYEMTGLAIAFICCHLYFITSRHDKNIDDIEELPYLLEIYLTQVRTVFMPFADTLDLAHRWRIF